MYVDNIEEVLGFLERGGGFACKRRRGRGSVAEAPRGRGAPRQGGRQATWCMGVWSMEYGACGVQYARGAAASGE